MIELDNLKIELHNKQPSLDEIFSSLDIDKKKNRIFEINRLMEHADFWNDVNKANAISKELKDITDSIDIYNSLVNEYADIDEMINLACSYDDNDLAKDIKIQFEQFSNKVEDINASFW